MAGAPLSRLDSEERLNTGLLSTTSNRLADPKVPTLVRGHVLRTARAILLLLETLKCDASSESKEEA